VSLDTIAIFDVATPLEPQSVLERVAVEPAVVALVERYGAQWEASMWTLQPSSVHARGVDIIGPGGIVLRLGSRSVEVYHLVELRAFAGDLEHRRALRRAFRAIARIVGSKRAVYTHELAATDRDPDLGTDEVIANLQTAAGPPAKSFIELATAAHYGPKSWYIETFPDFDAN
jgi:hypothetical protein